MDFKEAGDFSPTMCQKKGDLGYLFTALGQAWLLLYKAG